MGRRVDPLVGPNVDIRVRKAVRRAALSRHDGLFCLVDYDRTLDTN
jgi:hypothetical protein